MAIDSASPSTAHTQTTHSTTSSSTTHSTPPPTATKPTGSSPSQQTASRPAGFVRTPSTPLPTVPGHHEPEKSGLTRYITIGVIIVLVLLLIYQVISKNGLRSQVRTLESENESLSQQGGTATPVPTTTQPTTIATTPPTATTTNPATITLFTYPVLYREKDYQKIAQTISVTSTVKIASVGLQGTPGKGSAGQIAIYESQNPTGIENRNQVVKQSFDPSKMITGQTMNIEFRKPIELKAGVGYVLVVETTNRDAQANIGYRTATPTAPGTMWVYSRKLNEAGQVIEKDFTWQEIPGYDLFFELRASTK